MSFMVYRFGLLPPTEQADEVRRQMRLAATYRNTLTEIERARRVALREVDAKHGDVAALTLAVEDAQAVELAAAQEIKAVRAKTRSRSETKEQAAALRVARAATKEATRALREQRSTSARPPVAP